MNSDKAAKLTAFERILESCEKKQPSLAADLFYRRPSSPVHLSDSSDDELSVKIVRTKAAAAAAPLVAAGAAASGAAVPPAPRAAAAAHAELS